ncbi:DNA polymerase III subunit delta [Streptococcus minor]|uniref:DNA polymerase III subunit delta n=1 Tax=Streptococcus minor TaxID=229549 RepID=A0A3P1VJU0_9STRE|nr:DNA polymerase III subunit delta [Streptococcus minor]RRD32663.1 DNA polymerase III subunit delta [Streptococcus minor]
MLAIEEIQKLKKDQLGLVTVLSGEDTGQYQIAKEVLLEQIGFESADLNFAYFDMSEVDYAQVDLDLVSLPFFADEKIVILDYFSDLSTDKKRYLTDEELKQFEAYLSNPSETTRLIILVPGKLDSKRRLVKLLKRDALNLETNSLKEADIRLYFKKVLAQEGLQMGDAAYEQLLLKSNFDFSEMTKNLAFLKSYKASGQIEMQDVEVAIPKTLQDNVFDLSKLILSGQIDAANSLVRDLRLQGEDEIKLIAILLTQFRMFLQVKVLYSQGRSESQIVTDLSDILGRKVNPYQVKFALRDSRNLPLSYLKKIVSLLIETDYQIKTGRMDKAYLFDVALLKMLSFL